MTDRDYTAGLEGLQADMAEHQLRFSGVPTAEANRALAVDAIQRLAQQDAEAKQAQPAPPTVPAAIETTRERRTVNERQYLLKKEPDKSLLRQASPPEAWFLTHAEPRIMLLITKPEPGPLGAPSWRDRVLAVLSIHEHAASLRAAAEDPAVFAAQKRDVERMNPLERASLLKHLGISGISDLTPEFARAKAADLDRRYLTAMCDLLEASSAVFGDWKKDAPKKVQVG